MSNIAEFSGKNLQEVVHIQCPACFCTHEITKEDVGKKRQCRECLIEFDIPYWKGFENDNDQKKLGKSSGSLSQITLASFLQYITQEKTTYTLEITSEEYTGMLYIQKGVLVDAETETSQGIEAAYQIAGWTNAKVDLHENCHRYKNVINKPLYHILVEGYNRRNAAAEFPLDDKDVSEITEVFSGEDEELAVGDFTVLNSDDEEKTACKLQDPIFESFERKSKTITAIEGFIGIGLVVDHMSNNMFICSNVDERFAEIAPFVIDIMGTIREVLKEECDFCKLLHIEAETANILIKPLPNYFLESQIHKIGRAYLFGICELTVGIGILKLKLEALAQNFDSSRRMNQSFYNV